MTDPDTALAAIKAAGDDFQSLYEAIKKAEFLDATPGDSRQAYRAAKSKLKKILLAQKKKAEEDAKKGIVTKNYDVGKYWPQLKDTWESLRWRLKSMPGGATKKPDAFYDLYGFFQQATEGDNTGEQPVWAETGGLDFEGRYEHAPVANRAASRIGWRVIPPVLTLLLSPDPPPLSSRSGPAGRGGRPGTRPRACPPRSRRRSLSRLTSRWTPRPTSTTTIASRNRGVCAPRLVDRPLGAPAARRRVDSSSQEPCFPVPRLRRHLLMN